MELVGRGDMRKQEEEWRVGVIKMYLFMHEVLKKIKLVKRKG